MTNAYHAAEEDNYGQVSGASAARGAMLIALAIVIGLILLAWALDDPGTIVTVEDDTAGEVATDDDAAANGGSGDVAADPGDGSVADDGSGGDTGGDAFDVLDQEDQAAADTIPPAPTGEARPPAEVNVLVANGTGGSGVAGAVSDRLKARGYISNASNASPTDAGVIFYREGFADDARAVQVILGAAPDTIAPLPAGNAGVSDSAVDDGRFAAANVVVIVGNDGAIPIG